jgi:hypothetical protein
LTLILTTLDRFGVNQVSDRLVSHKGKAYDALRNKNVVWEARNGVVVIGFTGHAQLEGRWTDQWIAEQLRGQDLGPAGGRKWAILNGPVPISPDIGQGMLIIQAAASRAFHAIGRRAMHHQFIVSGWQWNKKGWGRPVLYIVYKDQIGSDFHIWCPPRYWGWERKKLKLVPSSCANELPPDLPDRVCATTTSRDRQEALVKGVRHVAELHPETIGKHCMSIWLNPPGEPVGQITFLPQAPHMVSLGSRSSIPAAYSPWIVSSGQVVRPSVLVGGSSFTTGGYTFTQAAPSVPGLPFALSGLP